MNDKIKELIKQAGAVWFLNEQHKTLYILKWT
jgi:hypothetical protein